METKTKQLIALLFILAIGCGLVFAANIRLQPDYRLEVNFYDVGQGDAIFIKTYLGNQILVDGGPGSEVIERLSSDMPFFDRTIEAVILSHPHADHVSGLIEVMKRYRVRKIFLPEAEFDSGPFEEFLRLADEQGIEKVYLREGMRIYLDQATVFDVYYPPPGKFVADNDAEGLAGAKRNPNDVSIVGKLSFGKTKFLFTGDAGFDIENILLPKYNLDSDVLKVGHHGSRFSTSDELLREVTPTYSVISSGKNSYGHPTSQTLDNLSEIQTQVFRTDENGTVKFSSDGTHVIIQN